MNAQQSPLEALLSGQVIKTQYNETLKLDADGVLITQSACGRWFRCKREFNTVVGIKFERVDLPPVEPEADLLEEGVYCL